MQIKFGMPGAFYAIKANDLTQLEILAPYLMCVDNSLIKLHGNEDELYYEDFFVQIEINEHHC